LVSLVAGVTGREVEINVIIQQPHRDLGELLDVLDLPDFFHQGRVRNEAPGLVSLHGGDGDVIVLHREAVGFIAPLFLPFIPQAPDLDLAAFGQLGVNPLIAIKCPPYPW
jgi:hypothetical protein